MREIVGRFTTWRPMGYGGSSGGASFDRYIGEVPGRRNGTYLDLVLEIPGQPAMRVLLRQHELEQALAARHGESVELTAEVDLWTIVHVTDPALLEGSL